jgi:hypothetical protein
LGREREGRAAAYKDGLVHEEDAGVGLEVDPGSLLDDLKAFDGDVRLIRETEANEVQHLACK